MPAGNGQQSGGPLTKVVAKSRRRLIVLLLILTLCALSVTPLILLYRRFAQSPTVRPAAALDRIAFITPDGRLGTVPAAGGEPRLLTGEDEIFQFPAWSADGRFLAVIGETGIFTLTDEAMDSTGARLTALYENETQRPFYLFWAPDNLQVSFLTNHPDGIALHLAGAAADGPNSQVLATGEPFYWDWLPDGEQLLIHTGFNGPDSRLALLNPAGGNVGENLAAPGFFQAPGVSAGGRYWAYGALDEEGRGRLIVQEPGGGIALSEPHFGQVALAWSPVADVLAYMAPAADSLSFFGPLRVYDAALEVSRTVVDETVLAYFWSPDGRFIAYFTLPEREPPAIQARSGASTRVLFDRPAAQDESLRLALWVVEVEGGQGRHLVTFEPSPLFVSQFLPFFDQYAHSHRLWSPASDALVVPIQTGEGSQVTVVPLEGEPRRLAQGIIGFWSHQ